MVSIVIPVFNEEKNLALLYKELKDSLLGLGQYELVFVDDGSTDGSLTILQSLEKKDKTIRIFSFRKKQGKAEALSCGFSKVKEKYIVTLDADLQDNPAEIPRLLDKAKEGWDVVCGWRKDRKDERKIRLASKLFNFLLDIFWGLKLHDYNCGLKVISRDAVASLTLYGGLYRFIPILLYQQGFTITELPIVHRARKFGQSKFGFSKIFRDLPDIFTMLFLIRYGTRPLHFFGMVGFLLMIPGVAILAYLFLLKLQGGGIGNRPILFLGMLLVLVGLQVFFTGFLADLFISIARRSSPDSSQKFPIKYATD